MYSDAMRAKEVAKLEAEAHAAQVKNEQRSPLQFTKSTQEAIGNRLYMQAVESQRRKEQVAPQPLSPRVVVGWRGGGAAGSLVPWKHAVCLLQHESYVYVTPHPFLLVSDGTACL